MKDWKADFLFYQDLLEELHKMRLEQIVPDGNGKYITDSPAYRILRTMELTTIVLMQQARMIFDTPVRLPFPPEEIDSTKPDETPALFARAIDEYRARKDYEHSDALRQWLVLIGYEVKTEKGKTVIEAIGGHPTTMSTYREMTRDERDSIWRKQ